MSDRDPWEQSLLRFARILVGEEAPARQLTLEVLEAAITRPPAHADAGEIGKFLYRELRRRALEMRPATPATPLNGSTDLAPDAATAVHPLEADRIEAAFRDLPEPGRSALALLLLDGLDADSIARVLGLNDADLSAALHGARVALHAALAPVAPEVQP